MLKYLSIFIVALSFTQCAYPTPAESGHDNDIRQVFQQIQDRDFTHRLDAISQYFVGRPYVLGPLGEGAKGRFDQEPLYRTDAFDCLTYVETVLALALGEDLDSFRQNILHLRYRNGDISFINRNHFMTVDWNKNNEYQGFIRDITYQFTGQKEQPIAHIAVANIDKPQWLKHMNKHYLRLHNADASELESRLHQLHAQAKQVKAEKGVLLYIPLTQLFDRNGELNMDIINQIPDAAILQIVRPNWNLKKKIGTNLNVSHLGFVFKTSQGAIFRHASSTAKKVVSLPLEAYLRRYLKSETVKGFTILALSTKER